LPPVAAPVVAHSVLTSVKEGVPVSQDAIVPTSTANSEAAVKPEAATEAVSTYEQATIQTIEASDMEMQKEPHTQPPQTTTEESATEAAVPSSTTIEVDKQDTKPAESAMLVPSEPAGVPAAQKLNHSRMDDLAEAAENETALDEEKVNVEKEADVKKSTATPVEKKLPVQVPSMPAGYADKPIRAFRGPQFDPLVRGGKRYNSINSVWTSGEQKMEWALKKKKVF
jgi:hypothetical protein